MTFDQTWYAVGTASVSNGSTTLTGQSTNWLSGGIIAGDYFLAAGELVPILTVNSNTSITLTDGWPGATRATDSYKIIPASDAVRVLTATRAVLSLLTGGNVNALAGLTLATNKGIYATGAGALATYDQTGFGRAIEGLTGSNGGFIRATGAGTAAMQAIVGTTSQSGGVPTGALMESGTNANGRYWRYANGMQVCRADVPVNVATTGAQQFSYPAGFSGGRSEIAGGFMHQSGLPNAALQPSNMRAIATIDTGWYISLIAAGTSTDPSGTAERISLFAVGRWF